jgi:hypothetical protein
MEHAGRLEHMKIDITKRKRRNVHIDNDLYKKIVVEAVKKEVDNGKVIEEALKNYFGGDDERQG